MSADLFQPGHRVRPARRYRDAEGFDGHSSFGGGPSRGESPFGAETAAAGDVHADAWHTPEADTWDAPAPGAWNSTPPEWHAAQEHPDPAHDQWNSGQYPVLNHWDPADSGEAWPAEDQDWNAWDDPMSEADHEPVKLADLGAPAPRTGRAAARRAAGAHRVPAPPAALKGRAAVVAVAAGAVVAAGQAGLHQGPSHRTASADAQTTAIRQIAATSPAAAGQGQSPQVLDLAPVADPSQYQNILQHGQEFAASLQAQANAKLRPMFAKFANGLFTSGFGARWGVEHLGVDIAAPIGTPIYAVEDGTVISAGPASGFGMWVRLQHANGDITVYGHVNTATVSVGQHVMAGDQIATVGNRGFSTGPHCHFEVWDRGGPKIDPIPWLASRGISLGPEED
ncbi:biotin carboxyl carrier protein [Nocardia sp. GAS34]|uniref:M23 family metallopeptidase n=1 Tax=unclassified Nocardia TaxID=2637762 RepID=UPI003D22CDF2